MSATNTNTIKRLSHLDLIALKAKGEKIVCLTAYSAPMARRLDGLVEILLVGDSLGNVIYGFDTTLAVTLEMMMAHGAAVVRGSQKAMVVVDLPFGTYQESPQQAFAAAVRLLQATGCHAVKLEGGEVMAPTIQFLTERGIAVMAHIGMTPQSIQALGSFGARGKSVAEAEKLLNDAAAVQAAGAFAVVIESTLEPVARKIATTLEIITIGIGASAACDGQVLVTEDLCGLSGDFKPKFVKHYAQLGKSIEQAASEFATQVRSGEFPSHSHVFADNGKKK